MLCICLYTHVYTYRCENTSTVVRIQIMRTDCIQFTIVYSTEYILSIIIVTTIIIILPVLSTPAQAAAAADDTKH